MSAVFLFLVKFLWLVVPGVVANTTPVLIRNHFNSLAKPLDNGKTWRGKRILGDHKTWRGLIFGTLAGIMIGSLQHFLFTIHPFFREISIVDFSVFSGWFFGFLMGFGALFGDAVKSFFKRRVGIKPGDVFFPWDQLDSYFGAVVCIQLFYHLPLAYLLFGAIAIPVLHLTLNLAGYYLGIKKNKL